MGVNVHALAPPVGSVEVTTSPELSTATHSAADAQDTPVKGPLRSTWLAVHTLAPPLGSVELSTLPTSSTATHSDGDGHDTPVTELLPSRW